MVAGLALLDEYATIVLHMKQTRRRDIIKAATNSLQSLYAIKDRVEKRRSLQRASMLMDDVQLKMKKRYQRVINPRTSCVDLAMVLLNLDEAIELYTKCGCDDLGKEAAAVVWRLEVSWLVSGNSTGLRQ